MDVNIGDRFYRWTVVGEPVNMNARYCRCRCDCGVERDVQIHSLTNNGTKSCGCLRREIKHSTKHGDANAVSGKRTRLYTVWNSMRQRCNNPNNSAYKNYGGRGISVCHDWDDFSAFREWSISSGYNESAPIGELTLDRIDVNGNYDPVNCRWVSTKEQSLNKRDTIMVEYLGCNKPLMEWCDILHKDYSSMWYYIRRIGLSPDEAFCK